MDSSGTTPDLTAEIVSKYVSHHKVAADQLPALITTVHQALVNIGKPAEAESARTHAVSVRQSVRHDYVVCLDCGHRGLVLRGHIRVRHGLSPEEYRQRWGLKRDHPLTAPAYSERRSSVAKALGLGSRRGKSTMAPAYASGAVSAPVEAEEKSATASKPMRRSRGVTKRAEAVEPADPAKPARTRRSRRSASQPPAIEP
jgi:predicted transcriptional regulator